jgi:hypothetical protein
LIGSLHIKGISSKEIFAGRGNSYLEVGQMAGSSWNPALTYSSAILLTKHFGNRVVYRLHGLCR